MLAHKKRRFCPQNADGTHHKQTGRYPSTRAEGGPAWSRPGPNAPTALSLTTKPPSPQAAQRAPPRPRRPFPPHGRPPGAKRRYLTHPGPGGCRALTTGHGKDGTGRPRRARGNSTAGRGALRLSSAPLLSPSPLAPGAPTYLTAPRSRAGPGPPASRQPAVRAGGGGRRRPQQSEGEQPPLAGRGCRQAPRSPQQRHVGRAGEQRIVGRRRTRWAERRGGARLPARARGGGGRAGRYGSAGTALPPCGVLAQPPLPAVCPPAGSAKRREGAQAALSPAVVP